MALPPEPTFAVPEVGTRNSPHPRFSTHSPSPPLRPKKLDLSRFDFIPLSSQMHNPEDLQTIEDLEDEVRWIKRKLERAERKRKKKEEASETTAESASKEEEEKVDQYQEKLERAPRKRNRERAASGDPRAEAEKEPQHKEHTRPHKIRPTMASEFLMGEDFIPLNDDDTPQASHGNSRQAASSPTDSDKQRGLREAKRLSRRATSLAMPVPNSSSPAPNRAEGSRNNAIEILDSDEESQDDDPVILSSQAQGFESAASSMPSRQRFGDSSASASRDAPPSTAHFTALPSSQLFARDLSPDAQQAPFLPSSDRLSPQQPHILNREGVQPPSAPDVLVPPAPAVELTLEQRRVLDAVSRGDNVFYTGSAGCGKSTVLHELRRHFTDRGLVVTVLAPTGLAALNVNGTTTWMYLGWTPWAHKRPMKELEKNAKVHKHVNDRLNATNILIIDEISMIENHHFERLNLVMKAARRTQESFGGARVVVTGDFCQLPPVKAFGHCILCGKDMKESWDDLGKAYSCDCSRRNLTYHEEDKWAFKSKAWEECNFVHIHLDTIHRQTDKGFVNILQKIRAGHRLQVSEEELLLGVNRKPLTGNATKLFALRRQSEEENQKRFNMLKTPVQEYLCLDLFNWAGSHHPELANKSERDESAGVEGRRPLIALKDHRYSNLVQLKVGMLVILLNNAYRDEGLCNGSQGIICGFEDYDPLKLPQRAKGRKDDKEKEASSLVLSMRDREMRRFMEGAGASSQLWPRVKFHNGVTRTIFADCSISELGHPAPFSILARTQIPLVAGWAMTIHKSQSLTMDRVFVDITRAWEEGQVYVALSRARTLDGLKINGSAENLRIACNGNNAVQQFLREKFGEKSGFVASEAPSQASIIREKLARGEAVDID